MGPVGTDGSFPYRSVADVCGAAVRVEGLSYVETLNPQAQIPSLTRCGSQ